MMMAVGHLLKVRAEGLVSFNHGVASGDPTDSAIILWSRVTPRYGTLVVGGEKRIPLTQVRCQMRPDRLQSYSHI